MVKKPRPRAPPRRSRSRGPDRRRCQKRTGQRPHGHDGAQQAELAWSHRELSGCHQCVGDGEVHAESAQDPDQDHDQHEVRPAPHVGDALGHLVFAAADGRGRCEFRGTDPEQGEQILPQSLRR